MSPQERLRAAVIKAQAILDRYVRLGRRDREQNINQIAHVLDEDGNVASSDKESR